MKPDNLIIRIRTWIKEKFTGIVHIHFHQGGIRKVRVEHDVTE